MGFLKHWQTTWRFSLIEEYRVDIRLKFQHSAVRLRSTASGACWPPSTSSSAASSTPWPSTSTTRPGGRRRTWSTSPSPPPSTSPTFSTSATTTSTTSWSKTPPFYTLLYLALWPPTAPTARWSYDPRPDIYIVHPRIPGDFPLVEERDLEKSASNPQSARAWACATISGDQEQGTHNTAQHHTQTTQHKAHHTANSAHIMVHLT